LIRILFGRALAGVWTRNTFKLGNYVPFISDIDITIVLKAGAAENLLGKIRKFHGGVRYYIPVIGELNLYRHEDLTHIGRFMNHCELQRDPVFEKLLAQEGYRPLREPNLAEKAVFVLRMLEYDWFRLKYEPEKRQRKWRQHFQAIGFSSGASKEILDLGRVISKISDFVREFEPELRSQDIQNAIQSYIGALEKTQPLHLFIESSAHQRLLAILYPQRFCFTEYKGYKSLAPISLQQCYWEGFAYFSQIERDPAQVRQFQEHLERLDKWLVMSDISRPLFPDLRINSP
jgi:hypothetical protein